MMPSPDSGGEIPPGPLPEVFDMEFRSCTDDAWYTVCPVEEVEGNGKKKLRVKYQNFGHESDAVFDVDLFKSMGELVKFRERFRAGSVQLQDSDCRNVAVGTKVCVSHAFSDLDVRFYDATVDEVIRKEHSFANGEEECQCTFLVVWQHGPFVSFLADKKVENICIVQSTAQLHPVVASFLRRAVEKLESASSSTTALPCGEDVSTNRKASGRKYAELCPNRMWPVEESIAVDGKKNREESDIDLGGCNHCVLLIGNLDKDMYPAAIVDFIQKQISVRAQACVFPSVSSDIYTRGAIILDSEKDLQKVCKLLDSPDHIVMSSRGRPLVVIEKVTKGDLLTVPNQTLMLKYQNHSWQRSAGNVINLKVVTSGSEEFRIAKELKGLFMEFIVHQQRLHKSLAKEERLILQATKVAL